MVCGAVRYQVIPSGLGTTRIPMVEPSLSQELSFLLEMEADCRCDQPAGVWVQQGDSTSIFCAFLYCDFS